MNNCSNNRTNLSLILLVFSFITCSHLISQNSDLCGVLPPHEATSTDPDSIIYDRFGNSYNIDHFNPVSGFTRNTCEAGYFSLSFEDINTSFEPVICQVFSDISNIIEQRSNTNSCGEIIEPKIIPILIKKASLPDGTLGTATPLYLGRHSKCKASRDSEIYRGINVSYSFNGRILPSFPRGVVEISADVDWHVDWTTEPNASSFDLYSAVLHEALHLLGFASLIDLDFDLNIFSRWDQYLFVTPEYIPDGAVGWTTRLFECDCQVNCWSLNEEIFSELPEFLLAVSENCTATGSIDFVFGQDAIAPIAGGEANTDGELMNNLSHLSSDCNEYMSPYIMQRSINPGVSRRVITQPELDILCELGYKVNDCNGCYVDANFVALQQSIDWNSCCAQQYRLCNDDESIFIWFDDLLCNDFTNGDDLVITDYYRNFGDDESDIIIEMESNGFKIIPQHNDVFRVYYTISGCDCKMSNHYFEVVMGPCLNCAEVDPCDNLYCHEGFQKFNNLGNRSAEVVAYSLSDCYWTYPSRNGNPVQNFCVPCSEGNNIFLRLGWDPVWNNNLGTGVAIPLQEPVEPGCEMKIQFRASSHGPVEMEVLASENHPCCLIAGLNEKGCVSTECGLTIYDPICIDNVELNELAFGSTSKWKCPTNHTFSTHTMTYENNELFPINYVIITNIGGTANIDDIIITKNCLDPGFSMLIDDCTLELEPNQTDQEFSHHWDFGDGLSSDLDNPTYSYVLSGTYTITHTITDECGNEKSEQQEVTASNCIEHICSCNDGLNVGTDGVMTRLSAINFPYADPGKCISFAGTIIIDQPTSFYFNEIRMDPNSKIIVESGNFAQSILSSYSGCTEMWQGIEVEGNARFGLLYSSISDALVAVNTSDDATLSCQNSHLTQNLIGIESQGTINLGHAGIANTTFSVKAQMLPPYQSGNLPTGIKLRGVTDFKIDNCTFEDLRLGIDSEESILRASNSLFKNIYRSNAPGLQGVAIQINNSPYSIVQNNNLVDNKYNIFVRNSDCHILDNEIDDIELNFSRSGIFLSDMFGRAANISGNNIHIGFIGLDFLNSIGTGHIIIDDNVIHGAFTPAWIWNNSASDPLNGIQISNNEFITGVFSGSGGGNNSVYVFNSQGISLHDNSFNLSPGLENEGTLLQLNLSDNNQIRNNVFANENTSSGGMIILESGANLYCCNEFYNLSNDGVRVSKSCGDTDFKITSFGNHETALEYAEDAYTGPQINNGNDWSNSHGLDAWHRSSDPDFIDLSDYLILSLPNNIIPSTGWFELTQGNNLSCNIPSDCGEDIWGIGGPSESDVQIANNLLDALQDVDAVNWSEKTRLISKINANPGLFTDPIYQDFLNELGASEIGSLADITQAVYEIHQNISYTDDNSVLHSEIIQVLHQVDSLEAAIEAANSVDSVVLEVQRMTLYIQLYDLQTTAVALSDVANQYVTNARIDLKSDLSEVVATTDFGQTYKAIFSLYLDYLIAGGNLTPNQIEQLYEEASRCYRDHGKGVILARNLYDAISETLTDWSGFDAECGNFERIAKGDTEEGDKNRILVYPNPFKDQLVIRATNILSESGQLSIFNVDGHTNQSMEWSGQEIILNTSDWESGVYLIEWKTEYGKLFEKIVK